LENNRTPKKNRRYLIIEGKLGRTTTNRKKKKHLRKVTADVFIVGQEISRNKERRKKER